MSIEIASFREFEKNTLQGFVTLRLTKIGLAIREVTQHEKDGKKWLGLPAKPYEDSEGNQEWSHIVKFYDKDRYAEFQREALKALREYLQSE